MSISTVASLCFACWKSNVNPLKVTAKREGPEGKSQPIRPPMFAKLMIQNIQKKSHSKQKIPAAPSLDQYRPAQSKHGDSWNQQTTWMKQVGLKLYMGFSHVLVQLSIFRRPNPKRANAQKPRWGELVFRASSESSGTTGEHEPQHLTEYINSLD